MPSVLLNRLDTAVEQLREVHQERLYAAVTDLASTQAAAAAAAAAANKNSTEDQNAGKDSVIWFFGSLHLCKCLYLSGENLLVSVPLYFKQGQRWVLGHFKQIHYIKEFQHIEHIKHYKQF